MSTCSILIKIKDYFPKIDSIPYQNYICLFTNGENEGQIPLISKEDETFQHQIKNVLNDIKYKIHVLDYNDMSLIGMCEMVISYNIISQITPPNGFVQEQQKKLLMDTNTKRKLFGTVLNMGDIYLNIYSEIYLCETKINNNINTKLTSNRKKNRVWGTEGAKKKLDGSPRTVHKKQIMMQINSDRRALVNINNKNGNNNLDKKQKYKNISSSGKIDKNMTSVTNPIINSSNNVKPNSSFNYKDLIPSKENKNNIIYNNEINKNNVYKKINNNIKNKNALKNKPNQNPIKNIFDKNNFVNNINEKDKENNLFNYNIYNRYKTESNKNNGFSSNLASLTKKLENIDNKKQKPKQNIKHSLINSTSPKMSKDSFKEGEDLPFNNINNNTGNKITTIESLENIDFSGKKYITKTKSKKNNSQSNITGLGNNTLFSTTSTEQEFNDMDKIILEKGTEIRNDFNTQLKNSKKISLNYNINNINLNSANNTNNKNIDNFDENIIKMQNEIKNNFIKLIEFYSLLSQKMVKIRDKNFSAYNKNVIYKEKLFTELKKNNALTQKKTFLEAENFMNINNHGTLNEKFLRPMIKMKKLEFKIFQNIFNIFYYEYDILKFKEYENNKKMDENVKIELLLMVFKNLVKNYGNISQVYLSNNTKKTLLKNCFSKYGIEEKSNGGWDTDGYLGGISQKEKNEKNKIIEKKENKNDMEKFKVIKEVDEEKEEEFDEEEKLNENSERISGNQISYSNSNTKDKEKEKDNLCSNEKNKSSNKSDKNISEQKKLFENNEDFSANKKENILDEMKYNLSEKINEINEIDHEQNINNKDNQETKPYLKNDKELNNNNNINNEIKNNEENIEQKIDNENIKEKENKINEIKPLNNNNNLQIKSNLELDLETNNKEKSNEEKIKPPTKREIYSRKNRHKYIIEPEQEQINENNNNIINNDNKANYRKNKYKKEIYDEEDLIMQKILTEDFPKKCKDENRFIRISKYEYSFGEEKIKVIYRDGDVVLQLDEGDYKLQEFIDILNEGKNEENNFDNDNDNDEENNNELNDEKNNEQKENIQHQEENEKNFDYNINENNNNNHNNKKEILENDKNEINSEKSDKENNSLSSEKKHKKRRKKRVNEDSSFEKDNIDNIEQEQKSENEQEIKKEKKEIVIEKEINNNNNYNSDIGDKNKISNTEGNESDINSENKGRKYVIKRRRDYKEKKLK